MNVEDINYINNALKLADYNVFICLCTWCRTMSDSRLLILMSVCRRARTEDYKNVPAGSCIVHLGHLPVVSQLFLPEAQNEIEFVVQEKKGNVLYWISRCFFIFAIRYDRILIYAFWIPILNLGWICIVYDGSSQSWEIHSRDIKQQNPIYLKCGTKTKSKNNGPCSPSAEIFWSLFLHVRTRS